MSFSDRQDREHVDLLEAAVLRQGPKQLQIGDILAERILAQTDLATGMQDREPRGHGRPFGVGWLALGRKLSLRLPVVAVQG